MRIVKTKTPGLLTVGDFVSLRPHGVCVVHSVEPAHTIIVRDAYHKYFTVSGLSLRYAKNGGAQS